MRLVSGFCSLALLALGLGALVVSSLRAQPETPRPNVIVILADDLARADLGCFGGEIETPNLDRLAAGGIRFTQAYNSARCCPSRAALMTGLYPHQAGVAQMVDGFQSDLRAATGSPAYRDALAPEIPTIADVLRASGYRTWLSGKWHLGLTQPAHRRGFERSFALPRGAMNYFGRGAQHDPSVELLEDGKPWPFPESGFYATTAFTDWAIARIREHDGRAPFFLSLAHVAPHWPLHALPEDIARQRGRYDAGYEELHARRVARQRELGLIPPGADTAPRPPTVPAWASLSPAAQRESARLMEVYAAQVQRMDHEIGRLLDSLGERGWLENTLIFFFSDNGAEPGQPGAKIGDPSAAIGTAMSYRGIGPAWAWATNASLRLAKCFSHEGGIAAPALAHWPGGVAAGGAVGDPVHLIDVAATCADLAGAAWPARWNESPVPPLDGVSLRPAFSGTPLAARKLFFEHEGTAAVREGRWKLVRVNGGPWELYDVTTDPGEVLDLAAFDPQRTAALAAAWGAWSRRVGVRPWPKRKPAN